ncbi:hypothetical protein [Bacillus pumilus]|uniref:hypothetical protein n=1 Tax=Bacillus pumilus TaxID=1408 RepID=UPI0016428DBE|nr:hypothetical protein [Bacillus pumilus]
MTCLSACRQTLAFVVSPAVLVLTNVKFAPLQYSSFLGLQKFSITLKRRPSAKIKIVLHLVNHLERHA